MKQVPWWLWVALGVAIFYYAKSTKACPQGMHRDSSGLCLGSGVTTELL